MHVRRNRKKKKHRILSRPPPGEGSRRLLRKTKLQHSGLPMSGPLRQLPWTTWGLARTWGAPLSCERLNAPPRCRFSLGQSSSRGRRRAPMVTGRLRPGPGGSGGRCITLGLDVLDRLCLLLLPLRTARRSPRRCHRTALPGDGGVEEACLVDVLHCKPLSPPGECPRTPWQPRH